MQSADADMRRVRHAPHAVRTDLPSLVKRLPYADVHFEIMLAVTRCAQQAEAVVGRVKRALALHYVTCGLHTLMRSQNAHSLWRSALGSCGTLCCAGSGFEEGVC